MAADEDGPQLVTPPGRLHRVGFSEDLSQFTHWRWQKGEARWDDPRIAEMRRRIAASFGIDEASEGDERVDREFVRQVYGIPEQHRPFRVLYAATTRRAAFVEVLQPFRISEKSLTRRLRSIIENDIEQDSDQIEREVLTGRGMGVVPLAHLKQLYAGDITIEHCEFADMEHVRSVQYVRIPLLSEAKRHGLRDVNRGSILSNVREFTQALSAWLYSRVQRLAGIRHDSTLGRPHEDWAVFESVRESATTPRAVIRRGSGFPVRTDDPELAAAIEDLGVRIEPHS